VPRIYQIEGDRLAICQAEPGKPRPTKFRGPDAGGSLRYLYRAKSKDCSRRASSVSLQRV
jgi:hypothetical protein